MSVKKWPILDIRTGQLSKRRGRVQRCLQLAMMKHQERYSLFNQLPVLEQEE